MDRVTIRQLLIAFCGVMVIGTWGYWYIEGWSLLDSFFMTVISITTVGYREVGGELSPIGKLFTVGLIFGGFGVAGIGLSYLTSAILRGELNNFWGKHRMNRKIENLKNHYVIAGYGRTGQVIAQSFRLKKVPFVVIDNDLQFANIAESSAKFENSVDTKNSEYEDTLLYVLGDACEEETLKKAGVQKAKGLIAVVSSDANNAFCIMSARELNSQLHIVARAVELQNVKKLKMAGANKVVAPYVLGGTRIAHSIFNPHAADFIDIIEDVKAAHIEMMDVYIDHQHALLGKKLGDVFFRENNILILGLRSQNGELTFNPSPEKKICCEDHLILMGPQEKLRQILS